MLLVQHVDAVQVQPLSEQLCRRQTLFSKNTGNKNLYAQLRISQTSLPRVFSTKGADNGRRNSSVGGHTPVSGGSGMHISWRECADMDTSESTAGNYYDGNLPNTTTSNNSNANNNVQVGMAQGNDNEVIPSEMPTNTKVDVPLECWAGGSQIHSYNTSWVESGYEYGVDEGIEPGAARGERSRAGSPNLPTSRVSFK